MDYSRIISLLIALVYVISSYFIGGLGLVFVVTGALAFVLALIWFSDEMGSYTGITARGPRITQETPGCIIRFIGWLFLLLPPLVYLIKFLRNKATN